MSDAADKRAARPASIGRYRILGELTRRAGCSVYAAADAATNRTVRLSVALRSELDAPTYAQYAAMFRRHAAVASNVRHDGILGVYAAGEFDGAAYLATELPVAVDLKTRLARSPRVEWSDALRWMACAADALHALHCAGFVHRDFKPANMLVDEAGHVRITGLDLARDIRPGLRSDTAELAGTPAYMSPEHILSDPAIDGRSDVFSAGIVLYELLTGAKPFAAPGAWQIAKNILQQTPVPPSSLNSALPPACDPVVMTAVAKRPAERYASAAEFAAALRDLLAAKVAGPAASASGGKK